MTISENFIATVRDKYKLAFVELTYYSNNVRLELNLRDGDLELNDFKVLRSLFYKMFDNLGIYLSVMPTQQNQIDTDWKYTIFCDNTEITDGKFKTREDAEYVAFTKCFSFYETRLFIEYTKNRYYDQTSDSACLNVNWTHLAKVINYKRKNLLT